MRVNYLSRPVLKKDFCKKMLSSYIITLLLLMTFSVLFVSSGLADDAVLLMDSSDESSSSTDDTSDLSGSSDATSGDSIGSTETSNNVVSDGGDSSADDSASEPSIGDDNSVDVQGDSDSADDPSIADNVGGHSNSEDDVEKNISSVLGDEPGQQSTPQGNELVYFQLLSGSFDVSCYPTKTEGETGQQEETESQEKISLLPTQNTLTIEPDSDCIPTMEITPKISLGGAIKAVVSNSPDKPEEIPKIVENKEYIINEYIQIRIIKENTIFPFDDTIDSVKIEFKVDKAWVKQYNIDIDTILIKEFSESVSGDDSTDWQVLPQKLLNEDENYLYYTVTVDSPNCLATFAIIGSKTVKVNSYSTQGGEISWTAIMGVIVVATFLLLVILFKAGYIYTEEYYIKKPKKIQNHRNINIIRQTVIVLLFWI